MRSNRMYDVSILVILFLLIPLYFLTGQARSVEPKTITHIVYVYLEQEKEVVEITEEDILDEPDYSDFQITAYDNSVESQGKWVDQTATGFNLKGHTLQSARCIAVDPKVIPLGSEVELIFDEEYKYLNGVYIARDTGGTIKGKKIDLFMGDGIDKQILRDFGRRDVSLRILN